MILIIDVEGHTGRVVCANLKAASAAWCECRDRENFGVSAMRGRCGDVVDDRGAVIAHISYNGRIWNPDGYGSIHPEDQWPSEEAYNANVRESSEATTACRIGKLVMSLWSGQDDSAVLQELAERGCLIHGMTLKQLRLAISVRDKDGRETNPAEREQVKAGTYQPGRIATIKRICAEYYGVTVADLESESQRAELVGPRCVAMCLIRSVTGYSLPLIAREFNRHHTTVLAACRRVQKKRGLDPQFNCDVAHIHAKVRLAFDESYGKEHQLVQQP